jgi:hypothetical protein
MKGETIYIVIHQVSFLITGLCTTLGTQWLFYHGAASKLVLLFLRMYLKLIPQVAGDSYLAQLAQYLGMILVGLIIPMLLKNKKNGYNKVNQEEEQVEQDIQMVFKTSDKININFLLFFRLE